MPTHLRLATLPAAPFIFGSLGVAYAVLPQRLTALGATTPVAYLALLCLVTLSAGFLTQQFLRLPARPDKLPTTGLGLLLAALILVVCGTQLDQLTRSGLVVAATDLGASYGFIISGCLTPIQVFAPLSRQALLTAWTYCLAYLGFGLPIVMSLLSAQFSYAALFRGVAILAVCAAAVCEVAATRLRPARPHRESITS